MPTVTETPVRGYAHCRNAMCPGYHQQEVDAVREVAAWTFGELGGDGVFVHMTERSTVTHKCADEADVPCPACGEPREVTADPRPQYQPLSGHDPMGLLNNPRFNASAQFADPGPVEESDEMVKARVRQRIREEQIEARLREEMGG